MKINLAVDLDIQLFSGSGISDYDSGLTNCIIKKTGSRFIVTQRPSIDISEDSDTISALNDRGRGIYFWEKNAKNYIIHDNDVYETTQDSTRIAENSGTFSTGSEAVTMLETTGTVDFLIILDQENNKGWIMTPAKVLDQIASNFPSTIVYGGAVLDGYLFVMDDVGIIYNSAVNDPSTFPATGFITAERERDKGVYLGKHHDNVVALSTRTIEFFYDNGNSTGSPLNRRQDVSYNIGCADGLAVWEDGDIIIFLGSNPSGQLAIYKLEDFQIDIISNDSLASYLTQGITQDDLKIRFSGFTSMGHRTLIITIYTLVSSSIVPKLSISMDVTTGQWGFITTLANGHAFFPLMAWTKRTGGQNAATRARTGEGIMFNGDIISINDKLVPVDTVLGSSVYESGVYEDDVYSGTSDVGTNIPMIVRTGLQDGSTDPNINSIAYKFQNKETIEMENTLNSQTLTIKHSDEISNNFDSGNTVDTSDDRKDIYQGGRFMKRNYQLEYSGNEQIYLEALDLDLSIGS